MLAHRFFGVIVFALSVFIAPLHADTLSFSVDNDSLAGTDREYSSGLFLRWSSDPGSIGYSIELASQMWTPSNIEHVTPQPNERPYAGLFYIKSRAYQQTEDQMYLGSILAGTVGERAKAEHGQSFVHSIIGSPNPKGWQYQISDEYIYQISAEAHRLISRGNWGEFSLSARGQGGNFQSEVAIATTYRFGIDLANTFGSTSTQAGNNIDVSLLSQASNGTFFFVSLETRYRFTDITIEGKMPVENDQLTIENNQAIGSAGFTWFTQHWGAALSYTIQSQQFTRSAYAHHTFGNVTVFYRY